MRRKCGLWCLWLSLTFFVLATCSDAPPSSSVNEEEAPLKHLGNDIEPSKSEGRLLLFSEYPQLLPKIAVGGSFGGSWSRQAATAMLSRDEDIIEDVRGKTTWSEIDVGIHFIRMPMVNAAVVETDDSLVVIDAGYASAGPVIVEAIKDISAKPVSHIFISHSHLDHAWGSWAIKAEWPEAIIIGQQRLADNMKLYVTQAGRLARYNNQRADVYPKSDAELFLPEQTFVKDLTLQIGGVGFELFAAPAETDDQFYIHIPDRKAIFVADYYQGFLPNAGNGKRVQRHIPEWIAAFRHMVQLEPKLMVPMHGEAIEGQTEIARLLTLHADALDHIRQEVWAGLNDGLRKDQIIDGVSWPEPFASSEDLTTPYVTPRDIAKMEVERWTGWWDDIPSHYDQPVFERQAEAVISLAGGVEPLISRGRGLLESDPQMALIMADWAVYGAPHSIAANEFVIEAYLGRILNEDIPTQELLVYLDHAAVARARLARLKEQ